MFNKEIFALNVANMQTDEEVLSYLAEKLFEEGVVKDTFKEAIIQREEAFATGLLVNEIGVAIPHTESVHVNQSQIAVMTLKTPVMFKQMGDPSIEVPVRIVFMLALQDANAHLTMLQKLIELIQNKELITEILSLSDNEDDIHSLKKLLATI